ncbi:actin-related protein 8 [Aplysia californica]|uniref:Actin-related protein 8 n=1 Tax=Aplysia californica TaxID=6500 RepID=A0ABM0JGU9_APLCA|nr:actin-related protein 8 [Aplysia californica]
MPPPPAPKKPLFPVTPDPVTDHPIQPPTIIVIQPGSVNLRVGRASDAFPITVPHCIARKCPNVENSLPDDHMLLRPECSHPEAGQQIRAGLASIEELLQSRPTLAGSHRQLTLPRQLMAFNSQVPSEKTESQDCPNWTDVDKKPPYVVGEEAMYIRPSEHYRLSWPMRRGQLNVHQGPGGTLSSVLADIEAIWGCVLQDHMEIPLKDLKHYRAVLLIPDVYVHKHIKALVNLLLNTFGFGAAIVHQESVCATYGSGITVACVVDVGDQKTSISCVEDGISHKGSRITMEYGGSDVSRLFHSLLARCGVALPEVNLTCPGDVVQLQALKETCCHLDQDQSEISQHALEIHKPDKFVMKYNVKLGDEPILAPMALFRPMAFGLLGQHLIHVQGRNEGDADDPHDEDYLRQTQRQSWAGRLAGSKKDESEMSRETSEQNLSQLDDLTNGPLDEDSNDVPDVMSTSENAKSNRRVEDEEDEDMDDESDLHLMGVDEAIIHCIEKCDSEELRRKLYSCILVVGGGLQFEGAMTWLQYQVWQSMPAQMRLQLETMDIITKPKDMDSSLTSWKGGAILACLDSTQELWVWQKEWKQFSVRMLRERAPFIW